MASVELLLHAFGAAPRLVRASTLGVPGEKADLVLGICRALGATRYLSGRSGASYLDAAAFTLAGVAIDVQSFAVPTYPYSHCCLRVGMWDALYIHRWVRLGERVQIYV